MPTIQMYPEDSEELARKQALAQMLRQQSMSPIETQSVGGIPTPISPLQGLSKMFEGYSAGKMERGLTEERKQNTRKYNEDLAKALQGYSSLSQGTPDVIGAPGIKPDATAAMNSLVSSRNPQAQALGMQLMIAEQANKSAVQKMNTEYGLKKQFTTDPDVVAAKQKSSPQKSDYLVPIQTAQGVMQFDTRRGGAAPILVGGKPIIGSVSDPTLQGKIANIKAEAATLGKDTGEKKAELSEMEANLPRLETVVTQLSDLGKTATYTKTGQAQDIVRRELGLDPRAESVARKEYIAKVDNEVLPLLRLTFGAQFTQKEGESLKVTLGDPNASPAEKEAVLRSFIDTKRAQVETQRRKIGASEVIAQPIPAKAGNQTIDDLLKKYGTAR